jgi:hypothetical protein
MSCLDTTQRIDTSVLVIKSVTDVPADGNGELPAAFALHQNYPNPFNPSTTISFSLYERTAVQFEVYNLLGQQIESRDLGNLTAGDHSVEFRGDALPSGVYFYRLLSTIGSQSRKMLLLK